MSLNAKRYRDELYRLRAHPDAPRRGGFVDSRDSFWGLYFSLIPFLALEYFVEVRFEKLSSGLLFPLGYLLFWAFYYSLYRPGFLEEKLSEPRKWDFMAAPTILLGVAIWFVKVSVVELLAFVARGILGAPTTRSRANPVKAQAGPKGKTYQFDQSRRSSTQSNRQKSPPRSPQAQSSRPASTPPPMPKPDPLPRDVQVALHILGLKDTHDWNEIHRRYRQLAKQFHPDLNPEITAAGKRFMVYDSAYRKLYSVKSRYFSEKQ